MHIQKLSVQALMYKAHRTVIFAIAQLSCLKFRSQKAAVVGNRWRLSDRQQFIIEISYFIHE